jgi:transposase-like protein
MVQKTYVHGVSTSSVDNLVKTIGMSGIARSRLTRLCAGIGEKLKTFLGRPLEGDVSPIPSNVCQMPRFLSPRIKIARA